jgi:pimeloyl-ACP methyl ester carboxylesterase
MFFFTSRQVGFAALSILVSLHFVEAQFNFDWSSIEPSEDLVYHDCYGGQKCARLLVPMDWKAAENGEDDDRTVAIAITKLPAVVPTNDTTYGGPIFWNPGGPGGSGVLGQIVLAANLQRISDKPDERHYDIISFDPRGVGFTTPAIDCYPNDPVNRALKDLEAWPSFRRREGHFESFPFTFALTKAFGRRCEGQDILPYVGTPSVARDMVAMVDAIARESEDTNLYGNDDVPRLQYIGFSYGTYLGNVFASLFPGLILDGVVDAYDHTTGPVSLASSCLNFKTQYPRS